MMDNDVDMPANDGFGDESEYKREWENKMDGTGAAKPLPKTTRVFIENLPFKMQWQALKDLIKDNVSQDIDCFVDLLKGADGRSTGEGSVNFNKIEIAAKAIEKLDGLTYEGRVLRAREDSDPPSRKRRRSRSNSPSKGASKKIIVSNLPYSTTWQQLKDYFRDNVGPVDYAEISMGPNGTSKGSGVVSFHQVEKAREAIEKVNNSDFQGRKIHVREETSKDRGSMLPAPGAHMNVGVDDRLLTYLGVNGTPSNTVYVGNLEDTTQWQKLKDIFRIAGNIMHVKMMTGHEAKPNGIALIQFDNIVDALNSVSMFNGVEIFGRPMFVRMYTEAMDRQLSGSHRQHPDLPLGLCRVGMNLQELQNRLQQNPMSMGLGSNLGGGAMGSGNMGDLANMAYMIQSLFTGGGGSGAASNMGGGGSAMGGGMSAGGGYSSGGMGSGYSSGSVGGGYSSGVGGSYSSAAGGGYSSMNQSHRMTQDPSRPTCTICVENAGKKLIADQTTNFPSITCDMLQLDRTVTWQALKDRFKPIGNVQFADLIKQNGRPTGCGLVKFASSEAAERAVQLMNGVKFEGTTITVYLDN